MPTFKAALERLKLLKDRFTKAVLGLLLKLLTLLLYVFGFSLTAGYLLLFDRPRLWPRPSPDGSWWSAAEGYQTDLQEWSHPS